MDFAPALPKLHPAPVEALRRGHGDRARVVGRPELVRRMELAASIEHVQTISLHFPTPKLAP